MSSAATVRDAILECFRSSPRAVLSIREVNEWIASHYSGRWKDVSTSLADLVIGGNASSGYRRSEQFLERVGRGRYRLAECSRAESPQRDVVTAPARATQPRARAVTPAAPGETFAVPGVPATFATAREAAWREALSRHIPPAGNIPASSHMAIEFRVPNDLRAGHPFDLDNLCEPVFSVVINQLGYCGGGRPNLRSWFATRSINPDAGCTISFTAPAESPHLPGRVLVSDTYQGSLPKSARDTVVAEWLQRNQSPAPPQFNSRFAVALRFGSDHVNIGDIATGKVKSLIDNLFPVVGGTAGAPEDWRINVLDVEKGAGDLADDQVQITITQLSAGN